MENTLKRRQPYYHEDSPAELVLQDLSQSLSTGLAAAPLPPDGRYIRDPSTSTATSVTITVPLSTLLDLRCPDNQHFLLEQASSYLGLPVSDLLDLGRPQHHLHKRPRLDSGTSMFGSYQDDPSGQDGHEKTPLASPPERLGGWTPTRIAGCMAGFAMCPPYSTYDPPSTFQPLPAVPSFDYDGARQVLDGPVVSLQPQSKAPLCPAPITPGQPDMFPCDDTGMVAQYLANYPPLQPTRVMSVQPPASREEMVYPIDIPTEVPNNTGLGIQGHSHLMGTPVGTTVVAGPYASEVDSPPFARQGAYVGYPPQYDSVPGYEIKDDPDDLDVHGRSGALDMFPQRTLPARRGPFKDFDQRERTARTRKIGSCIRCRMQRIRCNLDPDDEKGPCISCKKIAANSRVYRLNCLRWKITDVKLFKPGQVKGHEWTNRWKDSVVDDIGTWDAADDRFIEVTEGYTGQSVPLKVRRFRPLEGDRVDRSWVSGGVKKSVKIPPFAIVDMESAKSAFDAYIKSGLVNCCKTLLGAREKLLWQTYTLAIKTVQNPSTSETDRKLIKSTLELWMSVRLTTKSFMIVSDDTLDMPQDLIQDEENPLHNKIPLPPVMGAQIDSVLIHQIQPRLRRSTLEDLQKMTQDKKQKTWLTTYLVTFILLHNIALITKHDADYAKKHGMKKRFAREDNVREYNLGANTLLAYFHYCNKGIYPFSTECKDQDLQSLAELDDEAINFVSSTRQFAAAHFQRWQNLWHDEDLEDEYYYVSQLFEPNWQPRVMS